MNNVTSLLDEELLNISETDRFELSQIFLAQQGIADLILYSGDHTFLPEMPTERMAAIISTLARSGERVLENTKIVKPAPSVG
ncbi:MAG: hypothetical protein AAFR32_04480 [Pseudomonadota bacterium]